MVLDICDMAHGGWAACTGITAECLYILMSEHAKGNGGCAEKRQEFGILQTKHVRDWTELLIWETCNAL